jgi:hypothetical protein
MEKPDNQIVLAIIGQFAKHPEKELPQCEVVKALLSITTESYGYAVIRQLEGQGYITKSGQGNRKTLALTQAGRAMVSAGV